MTQRKKKVTLRSISVSVCQQYILTVDSDSFVWDVHLCLSFCLSTDVRVISRFGFLQMTLGMVMAGFLYAHMVSFLLGELLGQEWLNHMVSIPVCVWK